MMKIIRAKLHGIRVTNADLNYHGSITLDPEQCEMAGIYPMEFVDIWNKNSAARISTYVIFGEPGSRCCVLNGAAARTCQKGDELIIAASADISGPEKLYEIKPRILTFLPDNHVDQVLYYDVFRSEKRPYDFRIVDADKHTIESCHTWPNVDVFKVRSDLAAKGWSEAEIDSFIASHFSL
ncbi:Aspartate 1-decarboxylase [Magnetospirillum sp. XM-1]|uniref:aspartate 1-decarboxylase n=1 Tax=Magnetospirillum sp. XM-1 TaxID=1663591 RepID=UPI00073DF1E9|nr:aspartate 1-decarboxylase [Magnetospirillum sp. XM-1]CUW38364.1 Aspartate 1-decarboxylase [Magnetospirillum sp. XM-1]